MTSANGLDSSEAQAEIRLSRHAADQMRQRGLSQDDVFVALREPHTTGLAAPQFRDRKHNAWNRDSRTAIHVMYEEHCDHVRVVTAYDLQIDNARRTTGMRLGQQPPQVQFRVSVETEDITGDVQSVYFHIRKGKRDYAQEFASGAAIADYDKRGFVLGLELIAPCADTVVDQLAYDESRPLRDGIKRFMKKSGPREWNAAS